MIAKQQKYFRFSVFMQKIFKKINPNFNSLSIDEIKFIFNKTKSAVIVIDNIRFSKRL
jgi:hypothetical protein